LFQGVDRMAKPGRNDPCHCGSGKKYKKCCQPKEQAAEGEVIAKDQAAIIARYPEVHDGWDRLGMMYEAKGDNKAAADCYRKALAIIRERPQRHDPVFAQVFVDLVAKLDPPGAEPAPS
jgi:predicted TPR repeat methyltransferase